MVAKTYIQTYLDEVKTIADSIDQDILNEIIDEFSYMHQHRGMGNRLFIVGVGGSAANASHAVNDFRKILEIESYCVTDNVSELTARINDESWETSYASWLAGSNFSYKDTLLVLSVGGGSQTTSQNLVKAMEHAKSKSGNIISIVSRDGGMAKKLSTYCLLVPVVEDSRITPHAEEWQSIILHLIVSAVQQNNNP